MKATHFQSCDWFVDGGRKGDYTLRQWSAEDQPYISIEKIRDWEKRKIIIFLGY